MQTFCSSGFDLFDDWGVDEAIRGGELRRGRRWGGLRGLQKGIHQATDTALAAWGLWKHKEESFYFCLIKIIIKSSLIHQNFFRMTCVGV